MQEELQGPYAGSFTGLNLSSAVGNIPPSDATIFHNCDVSADGAVVRRGGTCVVTTTNLLTTDGNSWQETIRTRAGSEYMVVSSSSGLVVSLAAENVSGKTPYFLANLAKPGIWTTVPSSMTFIPLNAPYDRLLILTPEHPIVQVSFLERTMLFTCTANAGGGSFTLTANLTPNDTTLWRDTNAASYIVTDTANNVYTCTAKQPGFSFNLLAGFTVGLSYVLTVRQITWQWWAESLYFEGQDMQQNVSRFNVTDVDQNVRVPERLITDIDPIYKNSQGMGLLAFSSSRFDTNAYTGPTSSPQTVNQYGFSGGGRFVPAPTVAGATLQAAPFFVTFGLRDATQPSPIGQVNLLRLRELRFNGGQGAAPNDLQVYNDTQQLSWTHQGATLVDTFCTWRTTFTSTDKVITQQSVVGDANVVANYFAVFGPTNNLPANAPLHISCLTASTYMGGARRVWYRNLPVSGGTLDGCYVRAYGIGAYVDYSKRLFNAVGTLYRDRLVLVSPNTSTDQLLVSEISDTTVPGEHYQFMQVTDALLGEVSDPFTINVTSESRERITAITGWQKRFFVFTNSNTYSVDGGEQFGESSYNVNLVSTYGAYNQRCVVVTNLTVLYMNSFGLFDIANKQGSDSYGAFERTAKIRPLFSGLASSESDSVHWLHYNETTNKLYVGLCLPGDGRTTSRNLMLNVTWDAWTTLSSSSPFRMYQPVSLLGYTVLTTSVSYPQQTVLLTADMPFYMDYALTRPDAFSILFIGQPALFSVTSDSRGILTLPMPVVPGLNDYIVTNSTKQASTYQRNNARQGVENVTWRNTMVDYPETLALCGGNTGAGAFVMAVPDDYEPYTIYPSVVFNGVPAFQWTATTASGTVNKPLVPQGKLCMMGQMYPSVYASPVFDLESMGRLKRLRRLHLQFDTTITSALRHTLTGGLTKVAMLNAALVTVTSNYNENVVPAVTHVSTTNAYEQRKTLQLTLPLQGFGCDYQFYVASVGAEAFKLAAYEVEIEAQRDKRYIRR